MHYGNRNVWEPVVGSHKLYHNLLLLKAVRSMTHLTATVDLVNIYLLHHFNHELQIQVTFLLNDF